MLCYNGQEFEFLSFIAFSHAFNLALFNVCRIDMNFVIKVSDFGLSVDVYSRNYFRERRDEGEEGEDPVKLMDGS